MRRCLASIRTRTAFPIAQGAPSGLPPGRGFLWRTEEGREGLAAVLGPVTQSQCARQVTKGTRARANREGSHVHLAGPASGEAECRNPVTLGSVPNGTPPPQLGGLPGQQVEQGPL